MVIRQQKLIIAAMLVFSPFAANAGLISFSFDNVIGPFAGTTSGIIDLDFITGPGDSGTGSASSVTLTGFPAGIGLIPEGNIATDWANQFANFFEVIAGEIVGFQFFAIGAPGGLAGIELCINNLGDLSSSDRYRSCPNSLNFLGDGLSNWAGNYDGADRIAFSLIAASEPLSLTAAPEPFSLMAAPELGSLPVLEPGTLALLGLGLAGMSMSRRKKKV